jgi:carbon-monoxide dehydrogenase medium subunit
MYAFAYSRPSSVADAVKVFGDHDDAQWLAGGMTLLPSMKLRLTAPSALIDLNFIESMRGIEASGDRIVVGATTRHAEVNASPEIRRAIPALSLLAGGIGDAQVRNRGTIGGSISNNDPAADYPAAILGLNATIETDRRQISADDFFTGMFRTCLRPGELVTRVSIPVPDSAGYAKFPHPASGYAVSAVLVARFGRAVRVAVTGSAPCVFRIREAEERLKAHFDPSVADSLNLDPALLNSDLHASADYRAHLTTVMMKRAIIAALSAR